MEENFVTAKTFMFVFHIVCNVKEVAQLSEPNKESFFRKRITLHYIVWYYKTLCNREMEKLNL